MRTQSNLPCRSTDRECGSRCQEKELQGSILGSDHLGYGWGGDPGPQWTPVSHPAPRKSGKEGVMRPASSFLPISHTNLLLLLREERGGEAKRALLIEFLSEERNHQPGRILGHRPVIEATWKAESRGPGV